MRSGGALSELGHPKDAREDLCFTTDVAPLPAIGCVCRSRPHFPEAEPAGGNQRQQFACYQLRGHYQSSSDIQSVVPPGFEAVRVWDIDRIPADSLFLLHTRNLQPSPPWIADGASHRPPAGLPPLHCAGYHLRNMISGATILLLLPLSRLPGSATKCNPVYAAAASSTRCGTARVIHGRTTAGAKATLASWW